MYPQAVSTESKNQDASTCLTHMIASPKLKVNLATVAVIGALAWLSYTNAGRVTHNPKYVTRFFCSTEVPKCLTFEKPGSGLGVFLTLGQYYRGARLYAAEPHLLSAEHLSKLAGITLEVVSRPANINLGKVLAERPARFSVRRYNPTILLPRELGHVAVGTETDVWIYVPDTPKQTRELYMFRTQGTLYIVPTDLTNTPGAT